ncbi:hypothetical protein ACQKDS_05835 [Serratia sp. NPDC078593]|uniref:hypothetical protein n=1 Tax=unclassified Serratia (in: enterobacteria) TaxID=2647522 RepID=UPI0037CE610D
MEINREHISLLLTEPSDEAALRAAGNDIPLSQRLSWLYIMANVRENPLEERYFQALDSGAAYSEYDACFAAAHRHLADYGLQVDRQGLASDIIAMTQHIAASITWDDLQFDPAHPHFIRYEFLASQLPATMTLAAVCEALDIVCIDCARNTATVKIAGYPVEIVTDDDSYADLSLEEGERQASIALNAKDLRRLTVSEALELSHELGHCRHHLLSPHPCGDYGLPFWDTELPAFNEEWRLCTRLSPGLDTRAWSIEAIKQSLFALFPLLAPEQGVAEAFRNAVQVNPIYHRSRKQPEWLLEKTPLFVWSGVPYVHYFCSLSHFLLQHQPQDTVLAQGLMRIQGRFSLYAS